jgi:hypothetical protein
MYFSYIEFYFVLTLYSVIKIIICYDNWTVKHSNGTESFKFCKNPLQLEGSV